MTQSSSSEVVKVRRSPTLGFELLEVTSAMMDLEKTARHVLEEAGKEHIGTLRIAVDGPFHSIDILKRFRARHPKVQVQLEVGNSTTIESRLRRHQADVGVLADVVQSMDWPVKSWDEKRLASLWGRAPMGQAKSGKAPRAPRGRHDPPGEDLVRGTHLSGPAIWPAFLAYRMELGSREAVREAVAAGLGLGVVNFAEVGRDHVSLRSQ